RPRALASPVTTTVVPAAPAPGRECPRPRRVRSLAVVSRVSGLISRPALVALVLLGVLAWLVTDASVVNVVIAVLVTGVIMKAGMAVLSGLAQPVPPPPPAGELRKVKITYRCGICGTEVRMTVANDEMPDPPRHCQDDMDLVAPIEG
ncbi:MAG: hypothetical protein AB7L84_15265, partial [Acidimicrobiia bacterium]